jgi:hypothetical protein
VSIDIAAEISNCHPWIVRAGEGADDIIEAALFKLVEVS